MIIHWWWWYFLLGQWRRYVSVSVLLPHRKRFLFSTAAMALADSSPPHPLFFSALTLTLLLHLSLLLSNCIRFSSVFTTVVIQLCCVDGVVSTIDDDDSCWDWRGWWCCFALVLSVASINFGGGAPPHRKRFSLSSAALWQFLQMSSFAPFLFLGPNFSFAVASLSYRRRRFSRPLSFGASTTWRCHLHTSFFVIESAET